jgi:hypothetical protein
MKNKKIILEATSLILGTIIIITSTQVTSLKISESEYELQNESQQNNNMIFFGFGHIGFIAIDGKYDLKGVIIGNVSIKNTHSGGTWIPYFLFTKDTVSNKIKLKWLLPEKFILKNFNGFGEIEYINIPRGPEWTEFYLIGSFEKIIYN